MVENALIPLDKEAMDQLRAGKFGDKFILMDFSAALQMLKNGRSVTRVGWRKLDIQVFAIEEKSYERMDGIKITSMQSLYMVKPVQDSENNIIGYNQFPFVPSSESLFADDWVVVEPVI